jgi:ribosome-binding protein aMBF1 (putative translation factor)
MTRSLGQIVYLFKDRPSCEMKRTNSHTVQMPQRQEKEALTGRSPPARWAALPKKRFKAVFAARIARARETRGFTQEYVAGELGIKQDRYAKYEGRSFMPHELIGKFCQITRTDPRELFQDPRSTDRDGQ